MSINLLEIVEQNLGYPALQKVDPNTQEVLLNDDAPDEDKFSQAALPAVLIGLCKYVQTDEGAKDVLQSKNNINWVSKIFDNRSEEVIKTISVYSNESEVAPASKMNLIANEAIIVAKKNLPVNAPIEELKVFLNDQKNHILLYLPAVLHLGILLDNNTLDDSMNKMEGPVSSLIQSIGSVFNTPTTDKDVTV